jgi:hypothetical protein
MKLFKLIMNCVIASLLVLSVLSNIFIFSVLGIHDGESFKQTMLAKELLTNQSSTETEPVSTESVEPDVYPDEWFVTDDPDYSLENNSTTPTENDQVTTPPIYQDENVKITYLRQEDSVFGLDYKFLVENTSDRPLTITFSDLYIDGFKVDLSGLCCENLEVGAKSVESLTLLQSEWEEFTTSPYRVEFRIKLINPKSLLTIYETSDRITFEL